MLQDIESTIPDESFDKMRPTIGNMFLLVGVFGLFLLAGCIGSSEEPMQRANAEEDPTLEDWQIQDDEVLGWTAAVGAPGVPWSGTWNREYCPTVEMNIIEGTEDVRIIVDPVIVPEDDGVGNHEIIVRDHHEEIIEDRVWPVDDLTIEVEDPAPGTWTVMARPNGAAVLSAWPISVTAQGASPEPPGTLLASAC